MPPVEEAAIPATKPHAEQPSPAGPAGPDRETGAVLPKEPEPVAKEIRRPARVAEQPGPATQDEGRDGLEEWRERALRLQAEMETIASGNSATPRTR